MYMYLPIEDGFPQDVKRVKLEEESALALLAAML